MSHRGRHLEPSGLQALNKKGGQVHIFRSGQTFITKYRGSLSDAEFEAYEQAVAVVTENAPDALDRARKILEAAKFEVTLV